MAISDMKVKTAKPGEKPYKLSAGDGLYLLVNPKGSKLWRFDYRFAGKRKTLALGKYPDVRVAVAGKLHAEARELLGQGMDPSQAKKQEAAEQAAKSEHSFEVIAREWFAKFSPGWAKSHSTKIIRRFEREVFPWLGAMPIADIEPKDLLSALRRVEARGRLETAHRVHQNCGQVFRYAVATGRAPRDPSGDLRGALAPWKPKHYPSITEPKAVGELMRAISSFSGNFATACALRLAPLVFVRPGELRAAEWSEINIESAEWRIPAHKMKARVQHVVPLSEQALSILEELRPLTGRGRFLFPGVRSSKVCMSENTISAALRRMGYPKEQMTAHGFRSMASTLLNEQGWNRDAIERQLSHGERDQVRAAYNYAELMPERRKMMQAWADYLGTLERGESKVIAIRAA